MPQSVQKTRDPIADMVYSWSRVFCCGVLGSVRRNKFKDKNWLAHHRPKPKLGDPSRKNWQPKARRRGRPSDQTPTGSKSSARATVEQSIFKESSRGCRFPRLQLRPCTFTTRSAEASNALSHNRFTTRPTGTAFLSHAGSGLSFQQLRAVKRSSAIHHCARTPEIPRVPDATLLVCSFLRQCLNKWLF